MYPPNTLHYPNLTINAHQGVRTGHLMYALKTLTDQTVANLIFFSLVKFEEVQIVGILADAKHVGPQRTKRRSGKNEAI
jgi:hypothetical protein